MVKDRAFQTPLPMPGRSRGIVIAFRRRPDNRRMPSVGAETAKKPVASLARLYESRDVLLNADWDRLMTLIADAWSWRDPDCVAAVEDCLAQLRRSVDHDWS